MKKYTNKKGQLIGTLGDDNVYRKQVDSRKHLLKLMDAFGIDTEVYKELSAAGCKEIRIFDTPARTLYTATFEAWEKHSVERDFATPQRFLSRKYMTVTEMQPALTLQG